MCVSNTVGAVHIVSFSVCLSVSVSGFCFLLSMRRINVRITDLHTYINKSYITNLLTKFQLKDRLKAVM